MIPDLHEQEGQLPIGRYLTALDSVAGKFVTADHLSGSSTRAEIWAHFVSATEHLRTIVPVCSVWISGSFISAKLNPDDIDVIYWCEDRHIDSIDPARQTDRLVLQKFSMNALRQDLGLRLDVRVGRWHARPETSLTAAAADRSYIAQRGFWDDFWLRKRSGIKGAPPTRSDALPRRGYLEVILDGFDVS